MAIFCFKTLSHTKRLMHDLADARNKHGWSIEELSAKTHLPVKYIMALERGAFHELPPTKTFRLSYVRALATALELDPEVCIAQFIQQNGLADLKMVHPRTELPRLPFNSVSIFVRNLIGGFAVLLLVGYLGWQVKGILQPPKLTVFYPLEGAIVNDLNTTIAGQTEAETKLSINGQEVLLNNQGLFSVPVDLTNGLNTVVISAMRKHGKTTVVTRHLIARSKNTVTLKNKE